MVNDLNDAPFGLRSYAISYDSKNTPTAYGVVLTLGNSGAIGSTYWIFQLAFGTNGEVYHRSCINYKNNWTEWAII